MPVMDGLYLTHTMVVTPSHFLQKKKDTVGIFISAHLNTGRRYSNNLSSGRKYSEMDSLIFTIN
jgi:hypothetical protein